MHTKSLQCHGALEGRIGKYQVCTLGTRVAYFLAFLACLPLLQQLFLEALSQDFLSFLQSLSFLQQASCVLQQAC